MDRHDANGGDRISLTNSRCRSVRDLQRGKTAFLVGDELTRLAVNELLDSGFAARLDAMARSMLTFCAPADQLTMLWVLFYSQTMAHALGARARLSTPVTHVRNWNDNRPVVVITEHGAVRAKRIHHGAVPRQSARQRFRTSIACGTRDAAEALARRDPTSMKSAMVYERPFWRDAGLSGQSFRVDDGVDLRAWDNSPPDGALARSDRSSAAARITTLSPDARKSALIDSLREIPGSGGREADYHVDAIAMPSASNREMRVAARHRTARAVRRYVATVRSAASNGPAPKPRRCWNGYMDGAVTRVRTRYCTIDVMRSL